MIDKLKKINNILNKENKNSIKLVLLFYFAMSFLEILSLSLIVSYIGVLSNLERASSHFLLKNLNLNDFTFVQILVYFGFVLVLIFFIKNLITLYIHYKEVKLTSDIKSNIKFKVFNKVFSRNILYFLASNQGKLVNVINTQSPLFTTYILLSLNIFKEILIISIIFIFLIYQTSIYLLPLILIFGLVIFLFYNYFKNKISNLGIENKNLEQKQIKTIIDSIHLIKLIKIHKIKNVFFEIFKSDFLKKIKIEIKHFMVGKLPRLILETFGVLLLVLISIVLAIYFDDKDLVLEKLTLVALIIIRSVPILINVGQQLMTIRFYSVSVDVVNDEINYQQNYDIDEKRVEFKDSITNLELRKIGFSYSEDINIFRDLSFNLNEGDKVGVVGRSGSGKTTLVNLLTGLQQPTKGNISINEKNFTDIYTTKQIGLVTQNPTLLDNDIISNLTFFQNEKDIDYEHLNFLIKICELESLVNSLPKGLKTKIGSSDGKFSSGQLQRFSLVRTLYMKPSFLILDEGFNALDIDTERKILDNLDKLKFLKILIVVSHRITGFKNCNKFMFLNNKQIEIQTSNQIDNLKEKIENFLK